MLVTLIKSDRRAREKPCLRCGCSLRRIDSSHCPQCGLSVWLSLNQNDNLDWSRPAWLRTVAAGLLVLAVAQLIGFAGLAAGVPHRRYVFETQQQALDSMKQAGLSEFRAYSLASRLPEPDPSPVLVRAWMVLGALHLLASAGGMALLVHHERRYPDKLEDARLGGWITAGAAALVGAVVLAGISAPVIQSLWRPMLKIAAAAVGFATWAFLRHLARRMLSTRLARLAGWAMLAPAVVLGSLLAGGTVHDVIGVVIMIYLLVSAGFFVWFAMRLRRTASEAEKNWKMETLQVSGGQ